ncbi:MAG: hypothetical protein GTO55_07020, partial [Armatimonadetes bacterium]|nr:hypothetical protein [Armatimonadota bacterium]NIM24025.1 hypothetical protein [Armatimonadota bacterium]NIM67875.1 hypothetical protein [Armatimonadota bacterium]NIM76403.1 hypothetical protein [Armatimonadota bacterium]NIO97512.1 hypothetical protein [Armatimonadota bacterium]
MRCFVLGLLLWFTLPWLIGLIGTSGRAWYGKPPPQARAQLRSIRHRLAQGEAEKMAEYFPEGELFS